MKRFIKTIIQLIIVLKEKTDEMSRLKQQNEQLRMQLNNVQSRLAKLQADTMDDYVYAIGEPVVQGDVLPDEVQRILKANRLNLGGMVQILYENRD